MEVTSNDPFANAIKDLNPLELHGLTEGSLEELYLYDFYHTKPFPLSGEGKKVMVDYIIPMKLENIQAFRDYAYEYMSQDMFHIPINIQEIRDSLEDPNKKISVPCVSHIESINVKKKLFKHLLDTSVMDKNLECRLKKFEKKALEKNLRNADENVTIADVLDKRTNFDSYYAKYRSLLGEGVDLLALTLSGKVAESKVYDQLKKKKPLSFTNKISRSAYDAKNTIGKNVAKLAEVEKTKIEAKELDPARSVYLPMYNALANFVVARDKKRKEFFIKQPFNKSFTNQIKDLSVAKVKKANILSDSDMHAIADANLSKIKFDDYFGWMSVTPFGFTNTKKDIDVTICAMQEFLAKDSCYNMTIKENTYSCDPVKPIRAIHLAVAPSLIMLYHQSRSLYNIVPHRALLTSTNLDTLSFSVHFQGLLDKFDSEFGPDAHGIYKAKSDPTRELSNAEARRMDNQYVQPLSSLVLKTFDKTV